VNLIRFARRPIESLLAWQARYGDVFTVRYAGFGTGLYVGSHVTAFRQVIRDVAEREVAGWRPGMRLVLRERMRALTFEVICRVVFGVTEPERVARLRTALMAVIDMGSVFLAPAPLRRDLGRFSPGGRLARRLRAADALLYQEIERRREESDLDERKDVLSLLLRARDEEGQALSDVELRDELFTLLAAGHETTATALAFAFELLMRNPGVLARLCERLDDDAYLDATVKETLRLRPVIDGAERTLTVPRQIAGWLLPAGVKVYPAILLVQRREELYPRAHEFRPERFLEGAESYSWIPFGGGIRRCIGAALAQAEMAEVLRVVLASVVLVPERAEPDPVVLRGITLVPRHGVPVRVAPTADRGAGIASRASPRSAHAPVAS
jgi:cytochrome P450